MKNYSLSISQIVNKALTKTFLWMSLGLAITATTSYFLSTTQFINYFLHASGYGSMFRIIILAMQLILSFSLFFGIEKFSYSTLVSLFLSFSAVTGMNLSILFFVYELSSIISIFLITSGMFLGLGIYGLITKKDFTPLYGFINMIIWGLFIFTIINIFVQSILFSKLLCIIGIVIFALLTVMDIQNIKKALSDHAYDNEMQKKLSILGATILYQHFLSLFLRLLQLLGKRKK
jgi:FtsH-binding integral membrane protein